jgi:1,4-alpha-glucan branching enzyme
LEAVLRSSLPLSSALLVLALLAGSAPAARAAAPDNNIEWYGVSHVAWQDRRPVCPVGRESFQVRFQTYRNDITSARLHVADGGSVAWATAAKIGTRAGYDVWAGQVPAAATDTVRYWIELTDGTDTDTDSANGMNDGDPADGGFLVDFAKLSHAPAGATRVNGGGTVFKVWAPTRTTVHVRGDFNGWGTGNPMTKVGEYFVAKVSPTSDRQAYKYYFNGSVWNTDARARSLDPSSNENALIEDPFRYAWGDSLWTTPALEDLVVYQLHVGTFAGRNDPFGTAATPARYADVTARVSHLVDLGINAVMLNPVTEFPGDLSAGYNPQTVWAPEWKYGTPDELRQMVDTLHRNGIAVILDVVWNHLTADSNFLWNYDGSQTYFDSTAVNTPWGSQADFDKVAVRDYYANSALMWLEEYHVDGFRMDATDYMNAYQGTGWALMQRMNDEKNLKFAERICIAEQRPDDDWITRPTASGGAGFDCTYHDAFEHTLHDNLLTAGSGDPSMAAVRDVINGGGTYLSGRRVLNFLELHDECWPTSGGQRIVKSIDTVAPYDDVYARGRAQLGQGLVMLAPGVPAILMGTEWLEDTDFGSDAANKIDWSKQTTYAGIYQYFQDLVALRRAWPQFKAGAPWSVFHVDESANVLAFRRTTAAGADPFVVVANFGNADVSGYRIGLPQAGSWRELLNSQAAAYGGDGAGNPSLVATEAVTWDGYAQSATITLPRMGLLVFAPNAVVDVPAPAADVPALRLGPVTPSPARGAATIAFALPRPGPARLDVFDASGRRVRTLVDGPCPAGPQQARWDGRTADGAPAAAGVYFVRLAHDGLARSTRIALLR